MQDELLVPSPQLAPIIGKDPVTRTDAVKALWKYIGANKLQGKDARFIKCDARLKAITGRPQVTLFEMPPVLASHLLKRAAHVDLYQPNAELARVLGPSPRPLDELVHALSADLEELRDYPVRPGESVVMDELEALVEEADDPWDLEQADLEALVLRYAKKVRGPKRR